MWNKLSHAFNKNSSRTSLEENEPSRIDVMSSVYEQHPNLSNFHSEVPFPSPSAPPSPSKNRKVFFKRDPADDRPASPFKLPGLSKKVKSPLHINTNTSDISLSRPSDDSAFRLSQDHAPSTPFGEREQHTGRFGSLRSILRDRNTPGTGQNVRFFSRDAYKTISPNSTEHSSEPEDMSFLSRLKINGKNTAPARSESIRPSARDVFASLSAAQEEPISPSDHFKSHAINSLMMPIPPPDLSNIFDMSQEQNIPTIAPGTQSAMLDDAIEVNELPTVPELEDSPFPQDDPSSTSTPHRVGQETAFFSPNEDANTPGSDRSKSFNFGHPVFHPPPAGTDSPAPSLISDKRSSKSSTRASDSPSLKSRSRALSDSVFQSMIRASKEMLPETDINDTSNAVVVYSSASPEPDPFRANATTYYTPGTMIPPTPPQPTHTRKASREEDMIWSLRTQLALQQELCAQYEIDLGARDQLVTALNEKLDGVDKDKQHRNGILRGWKKKVQELERVCRGLENEVDRSRQESFERSVMDEASSEALRELHRVIGKLEREKADNERREKEERESRETELQMLRTQLKKREEAERQLREGIKDAKEQMEIMGRQDEEEVTLRLAESAWAEERAELNARAAELEKENLKLLNALQNDEKKENEFELLKGELEAQWKHTESMTEQISQLETERDGLKLDIGNMEKRVNDMEADWNESEDRRVELEAEFQEIVSEKNELEEQLEAEREHTKNLTRALHEREGTVSELENERQYAADNASRLEENLRQRDVEIVDLSRRIIERESEAEELREAMNQVQKERGRDINEQARSLQEAIVREGEVRKGMERLVMEKAETDVLVTTLKDRVGALNEELERLRRQVHDLQQGSADKEVKLTQFGKWRDQDKEDIKGLNIALDSKQQELELLKRKLGVRGTAGSTPMPTKRRESSMFGTPTVIRPPSALSDASKEGTKDKIPTAVAPKTLTKSVRMNGPATATSSSASAKPARLEGSMGPPPSRTRPSATGTPSRVPSTTHARTSSGSLSQSTTTKPSVIHRRASSDLQSSVSRTRPSAVAAAARGSSPVLSEHDEKENNKPSMTPTPKAISKRPSMIAA